MTHRRASVQGQNPGSHQTLTDKLLSQAFSDCNADLTLSKDGNNFNGTKYISKMFSGDSGIKWTVNKRVLSDLCLNASQLQLSNLLLVFLQDCHCFLPRMMELEISFDDEKQALVIKNSFKAHSEVSIM